MDIRLGHPVFVSVFSVEKFRCSGIAHAVIDLYFLTALSVSAYGYDLRANAESRHFIIIIRRGEGVIVKVDTAVLVFTVGSMGDI